MTSRTWTNTALYLGTTVLTSIFSLATAVVMAHHLVPEQFGRIGLCLSALYIAAPIISLAAEGLVAVNKTMLAPADYENFRRTTIALGLTSFALLQTLGTAAWALGLLADPLLLAVPVLGLLRFASSMATTEYVAEERAFTYAGLTLLNGAVALALTYLLLTWVSASASSRILALLTADTLLLYARYRGRMHQLLQPRFDPEYRRQIVTFGVPSIIALAGAWGMNESDKVAVAHMSGLATAGLYTAAATLAAVMANFNQSLTNALFPQMFSRLRTVDGPVLPLVTSYILKFLAWNGLFALLVLAGYFLLKDRLLPSKYAAASHYFYALVLASLSLSIFRPLGLAVEYFKLARIRSVAITLGGAATIACTLAGLHWTGSALWAPIGICTGYLTAAAVLAICLRRIQRAQRSHHSGELPT